VWKQYCEYFTVSLFLLKHDICYMSQTNTDNHNIQWGGAWRRKNSNFTNMVMSPQRGSGPRQNGWPKRTAVTWLTGLGYSAFGKHVTSAAKLRSRVTQPPRPTCTQLACRTQQSDIFTCACLLMDSRKVKLKRTFFFFCDEGRRGTGEWPPCRQLPAVGSARCEPQTPASPASCLTSPQPVLQPVLLPTHKEQST